MASVTKSACLLEVFTPVCVPPFLSEWSFLVQQLFWSEKHFSEGDGWSKREPHILEKTFQGRKCRKPVLNVMYIGELVQMGGRFFMWQPITNAWGLEYVLTYRGTYRSLNLVKRVTWIYTAASMQCMYTNCGGGGGRQLSGEGCNTWERK